MRKIVIQLKTISVLVMVLGLIHSASVFMFFPVFDKSASYSLSSLYMFAMTGLAILFTGWLQWFLANRFHENSEMKCIMKMSIVFLLMAGIGAVLTMYDNPFAYISVALAV